MRLNSLLTLILALTFTGAASASDKIFSVTFESYEGGELGNWLRDRPQVKDVLVWWIPGQGWLGYDDWPSTLKMKLHEAYVAQRDGVAEPLPDVPHNHRELTDTAFPSTVLSIDDAEALYLSLIAQSLVVELSGLVPWTLDAYDSAALATLFDGRELWWSAWGFCLPELTTFSPSSPVPAECEGVGLQLANSRSLPAPGPRTLDFLIEEVGIAETAYETIGNMIEWSRSNMLHFAGSFRADVAEYYWNYPGAVPAAVLMDGLDPVGTHPQQGHEVGFSHWTAGCHGTNTFFRETLRVINLPTRYLTAAGHATPHFLNGDWYLSHGDDPYSALSRADYPAVELLIDQATYDDWFGDPSQAADNIGRQVYVLAAIYLPDYLLQRRCEDLAAGLPNEEGEVFNILQRAYTMEELNALDFWNNLDAKIAKQGTCD